MSYVISDIPFNMNVQLLIPLDDLTPENGATSVRPGSQRQIEYPTDVTEYRSACIIKVCVLFKSACNFRT